MMTVNLALMTRLVNMADMVFPAPTPDQLPILLSWRMQL